MVNAVAEAVNNSRNPNHSVLMGICGSRGFLRQSLSQPRAVTYLNLGCAGLSPTPGAVGRVLSDIGAFPNRLPKKAARGIDRHRQCRGRHQSDTHIFATTLLRGFCAVAVPSPNCLVQMGITQYFDEAAMACRFSSKTHSFEGGATTEAGRARAAEGSPQAELIHDLLAFAPSHATLTDAPGAAQRHLVPVPTDAALHR